MADHELTNWAIGNADVSMNDLIEDAIRRAKPTATTVNPDDSRLVAQRYSLTDTDVLWRATVYGHTIETVLRDKPDLLLWVNHSGDGMTLVDADGEIYAWKTW